MNSSRTVLALETSMSACGVAVMSGNGLLSSVINTEERNTSSVIVSSIKEALFQAGISLRSISAVAVSIGPGSFTGLRIGLSSAKGLALGASLPIIPVPTFSAWARAIAFHSGKIRGLSPLLAGGSVLSNQLPEPAAIHEDHPFIIATRVNRDEMYFAQYVKKCGLLETVQELSLRPISEFKDLSIGSEVFGNIQYIAADENRTIAKESPERTIHGSRFHLDSSGSSKSSAIQNEKMLLPQHIAEWALCNFNEALVSWDFLEPLYIKQFLIREKKKC